MITSAEYRKLIEKKRVKEPTKPKTKNSKADYKDKMWRTMISICDGWVTELKFHPKRKWRFDWANKELMVAIEYEGGVFGVSRHTHSVGFTKDCSKYNSAQLLGWKVLRYTVSNYSEWVTIYAHYLNQKISIFAQNNYLWLKVEWELREVIYQRLAE
jgi:hypothetical protein